jgi:NDP-sugar pyrophosphorylase family protein
VRAFVLAGGLGTRLRPRFGDLPKPLATLGGQPFLARQLAWLAGHGFRDVVLCVGHGAAEVRETLGDGASHGLRLHYSEEPEPLGTGGALLLAAAWVEGPALVLNGDTLPELDPHALERARADALALGALALYQSEAAAAGGRVDFDDTGRVTGFVEKDPDFHGAAWVSGGCYAFAPALWERIPAGVSSLERDVLTPLASSGELVAFRAPGTFYDIGTPEGWERAERRFAS